MGKSTKSRVLRDGARFRGAPRGGDGEIKLSPARMGEDKTMQGGGEDPIL